MTNDLVSQWHPIATAPHNQTILVFSVRWGAMMVAFRPEFNAWFSRMQCPALLNDDDSDLITHWMPLPPVPDTARRIPIDRAAAATGLPPSLARLIQGAATREAA